LAQARVLRAVRETHGSLQRPGSLPMKRAMQFLLIAFAAADARSDAVPVLKSLQKWLQTTQSAEKALADHFSGWCKHSAAFYSNLQEEAGRKAFETERLMKEMNDEEKRVKSERTLATEVENATTAQFALSQQTQGQEDAWNKKEIDFLVRSQDLARRAMKLVTKSSDANAGAEDGFESTQDGVVALLSDLLHEADVQRAAIDQEAAALGKVYANFSQIRGAENGVERTEVGTLDTELRERQRAVARLSSQLADINRVLTAVGKGSNNTAHFCRLAAAAKNDPDGDEWKVNSVLDQLQPPTPPSFLQAKMTRSTSRAARLAEGLMQMAHHHVNPALESAAQALERKDVEISVSIPASTEKKDDPLAEIAAFGAGDTEDATTAVATDSYNGMKESLEKNLKDVRDKQAKCAEAVELAKEGVDAVSRTAKRDNAQLAVAASLAKDRAADLSFVQSQVHKLQHAHDDLKTLKDAEAALFKNVHDYGESAPVQIYGVATDLTAAGDKKVGDSIEDLVSLVQNRATASVQRHSDFNEWTDALEATLQTLERALGIEKTHVQRRESDAEAEKAYRASMANSASEGEMSAEEAKKEAAACDEQAAALAKQEQSLNEQLSQLDSLWVHVQSDAA